ncbi:thiamine pyrophosphate-binding protein [uncultured Methanoregula sp.]|uniref:alpha-keto acid decarboxylase family protein n=1 Tax=uncultured Methanoregula sp. TaxID=1005933 RepID=UPI002AAB58F2|nr:thiamine pyrophosphate-binding protein [uncultured Methanoregula sp.]
MAGVPGIGDYLISRLVEMGVGHVFGVPGDYVLGFFEKLTHSPLKVINTNDEQGAGFAADAYARVKGLGVVCVTYGVGGFKIVNTTAQAYAEKSPVLVISGAPGIQERHLHTMLHHKVSTYDDQIRIFERVTVSSACLSDPARAFSEIDRVLSAIVTSKRPGYLELPRDMVGVVPPAAGLHIPAVTSVPPVDPGMAREALAESIALINRAARPVILAGVEVSRYDLAENVMALASRANIPVASTILGKSAIDERHPLFMGIYAGAVGDGAVRDYVESSDCLLLIGVFPTDLDLGAYTAHLETRKIIAISSEKTTIGYHAYEGTGFAILEGLAVAGLTRHDAGGIPHAEKHEPLDCLALNSDPVTARRVFRIINAFIDESMILVADVGDALFGCTEVEVMGPNRFISPAYYASLGFAVPAGIGIKAAFPALRPLIIIGDGSFQMTGMEVSTAVRYRMDPIIVVLNNHGYGTERPMLDGPFNDVATWNYAKIPEVIGTGRGFVVRTEKEFGRALAKAKEYDGPSILEVMLEPHDISVELQRLTANLGKGVK